MIVKVGQCFFFALLVSFCYQYTGWSVGLMPLALLMWFLVFRVTWHVGSFDLDVGGRGDGPTSVRNSTGVDTLRSSIYVPGSRRIDW